MIIALARASDEIALIFSFIRSRLRRRSARLPSASDRLPPVSIWMAMAMARKSISGLSMTRAMRQSAASSGSPSMHPLADRLEVAADRGVVLLADACRCTR